MADVQQREPMAAEPQMEDPTGDLSCIDDQLPATGSTAAAIDEQQQEAQQLPTGDDDAASAASCPPSPTPAPSSSVAYSCPCCCPCAACVAARSACTDPNCTTCRPALTAPFSQHAAHAAAAQDAAAAADSHHHHPSHSPSIAPSAAPVPSSAASFSPTLAAAAASGSQAAPTLATAVQAAAGSVPGVSVASPAAATLVPASPRLQAASTPTAAAAAATALAIPSHLPFPASASVAATVSWPPPSAASASPAASNPPCTSACCSPAASAASSASHGAGSAAVLPAASSSAAPSPAPAPFPMDDRLLAFSALLYRCLNNKAALQRMFDCGCLEAFITQQAGKMTAAAAAASPSACPALPLPKLQLTVNTGGAAAGDDWGEEGKKKRKAQTPSAAGSKAAKKARPDKPRASLAAVKARGKADSGSGAQAQRASVTASPAPSEPGLSLTPCSSPTALHSIPALVRSNTVPAVNASIMNSPTPSSASPDSASPAAPTAATVASPVSQPVAASASASKSAASSPSPRRAPVKAAAKRQQPVKAERATAGRRTGKVTVASSASVSAPNTPLSSRVLDLGGRRPAVATLHKPGRAAKAARGGAAAMQPHSPSSSVLSGVSASTASSPSAYSAAESALSPSLQFCHASDAMLPALSLPSSYGEVSLHADMEEMPADDDSGASLYRAPYRAVKTKVELVDDVAMPSAGYRTRPRTLSESHPAHPLHSMQESGSSLQHDFLVHEPAVSLLAMDDPSTAPLSPSSSSYHSGADSMDTEHSSPIPELEADCAAAISSTAGSAADALPLPDSSWALNLDGMDSALMMSALEMQS